MTFLREAVKKLFNINKTKKKLVLQKLVLQRAEEVGEITKILANNKDLDAVIYCKDNKGIDVDEDKFKVTYLYFDSYKKATSFTNGLGIVPRKTLFGSLYCATVFESPQKFVAELQNSGYFDVTIR